jgi:Transglutaminase-like superfamily
VISASRNRVRSDSRAGRSGARATAAAATAAYAIAPADPAYFCTTNDEGMTSAIQSAAPARPESTTAAILRLVRRCARLRAFEWRLLTAAAAAQIAIAAALRLAPLGRVRRGAAFARPIVRAIGRGSDDRVVWAILATGRRLRRWSTCLVRALAAEMIVADGRDLVLTIGVKRTGRLVDAHAWLARGDRVLVGETADEFAPLVVWGRASA